MEPETVERLSRAVAGGMNRRQAAGRLGGGGLLAGLGIALGVRPRALAAEVRTCAYDFAADLRAGPDSEAGGALARLEGVLTLEIGGDGAIDHGKLETENDTWSIAGQSSGRAISLWVRRGEDVLVALGVGKQRIAGCQGELRGSFTGPSGGDAGDWRATVRSEATPTVTATRTTSAPSTSTPETDQPTATSCDLVCADGTTGEPTAGCECVCQDLTRTVCISGTETGRLGACVDLTTNADSCGVCGYVCRGGDNVDLRACSGGNCKTVCVVGYESCNPETEEPCAYFVGNDPLNCGSCGNACRTDSPYFGCVDGECVCTLDQECKDQGNLGAKDDCFACRCRQGTDNCGTMGCIDILSDPENCGACGNRCSSFTEPYCVFGRCTSTQI